MSRPSSTPPKERVNIVYKSRTDGATEQVELPLKMLVMGDFTQKSDAAPVGERHPVRIDKDNFGAVMQACNLSLDVRVLADPRAQPPAHEGDIANTRDVHLEVRSLKDLEPESICNQVPQLREMLALREALVALKGPLGNLPAFRKKLTALLHDPQARAQLMAELGVTPSDVSAQPIALHASEDNHDQQ